MKVWFCTMAGPNSLENLKELLEPIYPYVNGLVIVLHDSQGSEEDKYLESIKGDGKIIHIPYTRRHDFSRNHYLYCGPIEVGDWIVQCDDLERINENLIKNIDGVIDMIKSYNSNACWYYGKPFIYEYHDSLQFSGSPHEGLRRYDGKMKSIELNHQYPTETDIRWNVRPLKRKDPYHWVGHYAKYYLFPWGSNQCLLGNENRGDPSAIFQERETVRHAFIDLLRTKNIKVDLESLKKYWLENPLDDKMQIFINKEKILNDAYRYFILKDLTVKDEHFWTSLKTI